MTNRHLCDMMKKHMEPGLLKMIDDSFDVYYIDDLRGVPDIEVNWDIKHYCGFCGRELWEVKKKRNEI